MTLHIHLTTEPDPELQAALRRIEDALQAAKHKDETNMSQITDWAAEQQADLTAISNTLDTVVAGIAALDELITNFQNSPGAITPEDQAALDQIQNASHALVTKASAISTAAPGTVVG